MIVDGNVVFGPGDFNFPDPKAGLADLTGYKETLALAFNGTADGKTRQWSKTYVMLGVLKPAARQLTIEKTGDLPDLDPVFMAEKDGVAYESIGGNACNAAVLDPVNSFAGRLEPAGLLTGVIGAEAAGRETVNGVAADHYTFDERAFGQLGVAKSAGEMWVAAEGGYIVKYVLTTTGDANYFGEGVEGTLTWDYELTGANKPAAIELPADCPAGMVDAPLLPDAANILKEPGLLMFDTASSLADAVAFYQTQIPALGWTPDEEPAIYETTAMFGFARGDQILTVMIAAGAGSTNVMILLDKAGDAFPGI